MGSLLVANVELYFITLDQFTERESHEGPNERDDPNGGMNVRQPVFLEPSIDSSVTKKKNELKNQYTNYNDEPQTVGVRRLLPDVV